MKSLSKVIAIAAVVVAPLTSFAQSNQPLTRAEVRQQLVELHNVGYSPLDDRNSWPANIQAAEARLAAQKEAAATANTSYGAGTAGTTQAGH